MHPEIVKYFDGIIGSDFIPNLKQVYYPVGDGMLSYELVGDTAKIHSYIVGGFKGDYIKEIQKHKKDLGVKRIIGRINQSQKRAAAMYRVCGFELVSHIENTKTYEVLV